MHLKITRSTIISPPSSHPSNDIHYKESPFNSESSSSARKLGTSFSSPLPFFVVSYFFVLFSRIHGIPLHSCANRPSRSNAPRLFCHGFSVSFLQIARKGGGRRAWLIAIFHIRRGVLGIGNDFRARYSNVKKKLPSSCRRKDTNRLRIQRQCSKQVAFEISRAYSSSRMYGKMRHFFFFFRLCPVFSRFFFPLARGDEESVPFFILLLINPPFEISRHCD